MDRVIVVSTDRKTQIARLQRRNRMNTTEALRRIRSQMPLAKKVSLSDYVIDGKLPPTQLRHAVSAIFEDLKRLA
jgi:dephospho-CoA kinase